MAQEAEIKKIKIVVEGEVSDALKQLEALKKQLKAIKNAANITAKISIADTIAKDAEKAKNALGAVRKGINFTLQGKPYTNPNFEMVGEAYDGVADRALMVVDAFRQAQTAIVPFKSAAIEVGYTVQEVSGSMSELAGTTAEASSQAGKFSFAMPFLKTTINSFAAAIDKACVPVARFVAQLKKIMVYRIIRGGISQIIKDLETGKQAIKSYDEAFSALNGRASASKAAELMKEMAENATLLRNTFASLFMTVYASLQPAINAIVNILTDAMNAVNKFLSALMGRGYYTKAIKGVSETTKAVKALKKQIFGFDELNILNAPTGSDTEDFSKQFTEEKIDGILGKIAEFQATIGKFFDTSGLTEPLLKALAAAGGIIALWKLGDGLMKFLEFVNNPAVQVTAGITLMVVGVTGLYSSLKDAITEGLTEENVIAAFLGTGAITLGGFAVGKALGNSALGGMIAAIAVGGTFLWVGIEGAFTDGIQPLEALLITLGTWIIASVAAKLMPKLAFALGGFKGLIIGAVIALGIYIYQHWDEIVAKLKEGWDTMKTNWNKIVDEFKTGWHDFITSIGDYLKQKKEDFKKSWEEFWNSPFDWVKKKFEKIFEWIDKVKSFDFNGAIEKGKQAAQKALETTRAMGIDPFTGFANGGFPTTGDLFIANEAGPELVGSFGNRTGVYNQEQFAGAMAAANQQVVNAVLAIGSQITGAVNNKPVPSVRIGDRDIFNASQRGSTLVGSSLIQGGRP